MSTSHNRGEQFLFEECLGEYIRRQWLQFWVVTVFHLSAEQPYWPEGSIITQEELVSTRPDPVHVFNVSAVCKTLHAAVRVCVGQVMLCQHTTSGALFWRGDLRGLAWYHRPKEHHADDLMALRGTANAGNKSYWLHSRLIQRCAAMSMQQLLESWTAATWFTQSTPHRPNHVRVMTRAPCRYKNDFRWEVLSNSSGNFAATRDSEPCDDFGFVPWQ